LFVQKKLPFSVQIFEISVPVDSNPSAPEISFWKPPKKSKLFYFCGDCARFLVEDAIVKWQVFHP